MRYRERDADGDGSIDLGANPVEAIDAAPTLDDLQGPDGDDEIIEPEELDSADMLDPDSLGGTRL